MAKESQIPLINNWTEHLKHMRNQYYCIEGIDQRLVNATVFEDTQTVRVMFANRTIDIDFADMPTEMQKWIPVTDGGFMTTYDHWSAEAGLKPTELGMLPASAPTPPTQEKPPSHMELLASEMVQNLPGDINDMRYVMDQVKAALINVKDKPSYLPVVKGITSLLKTIIDAKKVTIDQYNSLQKLFMSMRKIEQEEEKKAKKKEEGEDGN